MDDMGGKDGRGLWKDGLPVFEKQVLLFPLLVVVLACASFPFGGRCAAWQWWTGVAMVVAAPFSVRGGWRAALGAAGLFAVLLVALEGALPPACWDNASGADTRLYHFPAIQLLVEGWNPVADPLAEGITARLGLDLWGMAPVQVAFLAKTMAVFAAVSCKVVGDPTSTTIPGLALLWASCAMQAVRTRKGVARWVALAAVAWILPLVCRRIFVDLALAYAACGLLFSMERDLRRDGCDWLHLGTYTVWMVSIKLNGVLAAFVFWVLFAAAKTRRARRGERMRWLGKCAVFAAGVALAWGVVCWNPLVTSWRTYGHPLYPFKTADAGKWPVRDPTWDLRLVNGDFRRMGTAGIWLYEYVSPRMVEAYYRRKTGNGGFAPRRKWVPDESFVHGHRWVRPALWVLFAVLLLHPRGRWAGFGGLLLTGLVPWDKIGYTRYEPWLSSLGCLALALGAEWMAGKGAWLRRGMAVAAAAALAAAGGLWLRDHAGKVEFKAAELRTERDAVRCRVFMPENHSPADVTDPADFVPRYNYLTAMENHCRLLLRQLGREKTEVLGGGGYAGFGGTEKRLVWMLDERQWFEEEGKRDGRAVEDLGPAWRVWDADGGGAEIWEITPWEFYLVRRDERTGRSGNGVRPSAAREARFFLRAWLRTYPREVWKWLSGRGPEREA